LRANSFVINTKDVDLSNKDAQILSLSNAEAWTIDGDAVSNTELKVNDNGSYTTTVGNYIVKIGLTKEATLVREITAKVVNRDVIDNGEYYSIAGDHFRINVTDANVLRTKPTADIAADFIARAAVDSYKRSSALDYQAGTRVLVSDGGFAAHGIFNDSQQGLTFNVTFNVAEDPTAEITVTLTISNGTPPILTVPPVKYSPLGQSITDAFYRDGVIVNDSEDGNDLNIDDVTYDASAVNINKKGVYKVVYKVTDSDYNPVTAEGTIAVGYNPDGDYAVDAYSFVTTKDDVLAAGTNIDALILGKSHADAKLFEKVITGSATTIKLTQVPAVVKNTGGFSSTVNTTTGFSDYSITIGVVATSPYTGDPTVTITGKVIDKDIISNTPEVDDNGTPDPADDINITPPNGNDENLDDPSDTNRYIVSTNNAVIRTSEVASYVGLDSVVKARLIDKAQAEALRIAPDAAATITSWDVDVIANDIPQNAAVGESFYVTFIAKSVPSVYAKAKFTISKGDAPVINFDPLEFSTTPVSTYIHEAELLQGVTATDTEDGNLISSVKVLEPGTTHLPVIDKVVPGIYQVEYQVTDSENNTTTAKRAVIVNDGRYDPIDEDGDGDIDILIGARNYVVKRAEVLDDNTATPANETLEQAKNLSGVEAYDITGANLAAQITAVNPLPQSYLNKELGIYPITWTVSGHPATVVKAITGEIIPDDSIVSPIDRASLYAIVAQPFTVNTQVAATINDPAHFISRTKARVVKLVNKAADKGVVLVSTGGFTNVQGTYPITFRADGIDPAVLSLTVDGKVSNGNEPKLFLDTPIIIPASPAGSPNIDLAKIINAGHITAIDTEAIDPATNPTGDVTSYVQVIDTATGQSPSISANQPGVHQVTVSILDGDNNLVEKKVAVVIDDGTFIYGAGHIVRAHDFTIDLRDVEAGNAIEQIRSQSGLQAWLNSGDQVPGAVISTGGYNDAVGSYAPVVGVYGGSSLNPALSKALTVHVVDTFIRYHVTFNANGGTLIGPQTITVVEPQTSLPYLPASPIRDGYTFRFWSTSPAGGSQFAAGTPLTGDITLYAAWQAIPTPPPPPPAPTPAPIIVNSPPSYGGATYVTVEPSATPVTLPETQTPEASGDTGTKLPPEPTPLAGPGWSLFNLLATILSLLLLVVFFIKFFFDRPRDEEYEEEPIDAQLWEAMTPEQRAQYQARREADYQAWFADRQKGDTRQKALFVNAPVLLIVGAGLVEALIVLFKTQVFTQPMGVVDDFSVIFALILFVQLLAPMVAAIIRNNRRDDQQTPPQPKTGDAGVTL
ncbi:MAG: InlB B-repeat-containing protein, partial [Coriobacteriales bacterium]|nr:InlB B-repeat-containing protein [Coriobacteriales bacterium]